MKFTRVMLLFILTFPLAVAHAAKLSYHGGASSFELEMDSEVMTYESGQKRLQINIRDCNRKIVAEYWSEAVGEFQKFPLAVIKHMPPKKPYAMLDQEARWIVPFANSRLSVSPESFFVLKLREAKLCKGS